MNLTKSFIAVIILSFCCACKNGEQQETENNRTSRVVVQNSISKLQEFTITGEHKTVNGTYKYNIRFRNSEELPIITNPMEYRYYDNMVELTVMKGTRIFFRHTFTKKDFKQYVPEKFYNTSGLIGFSYNYDKENNKTAIFFIATIGDPDVTSDISHALEIKIDDNGKMSISDLKDRDTLPIKKG
ncbi:MAG: DUF4738 domain-containing protein, partial [Bacteroidaceae bacterium]|nr:DUF4738 domain-containing protein [Bacteroidaceae bacterium]